MDTINTKMNRITRFWLAGERTEVTLLWIGTNERINKSVRNTNFSMRRGDAVDAIIMRTLVRRD